MTEVELGVIVVVTVGVGRRLVGVGDKVGIFVKVAAVGVGVEVSFSKVGVGVPFSFVGTGEGVGKTRLENQLLAKGSEENQL